MVRVRANTSRRSSRRTSRNRFRISLVRQIKLLLFDIDGTLTGPDGRGHSARLLPLMQQLMGRGVRIGVVTGRDMLSARVVHRLFNLNGPIIGENGAEILLRPGEAESSPRVCGGLSPSHFTELVQKIGMRGFFKYLSIDREKKRMITLYPRFPPQHKPETLPAWSRRVAAALRNTLAGLEITYSSAAIDICARGTNKAKGIRLACQFLRTAPRAVAFVGDSNNDQAAFAFVRRHNGWIAFVGTDQAVRRSLQDYPRAFVSQHRASDGSAEFMQFLLDHSSILSAARK